MFDESALRRDPFIAGSRIKLSDGQEWELPRPRVGLKPSIKEGKVTFQASFKSAAFGPELDELMDVVLGFKESEPWDFLTARCQVAFGLLRQNYDLPDEAISELFLIEPGDTESDERWQAIMEAITGTAPKPVCDTSADAS
jgi:hypothetical protein